jgi:hypothetical protein
MLEVRASNRRQFTARTVRAAPEVDYPGMRERLVTPTPQGIRPHDESWLDLDSAAMVEITSEEKEYPVEAALISGDMRGWRAADSALKPSG